MNWRKNQKGFNNDEVIPTIIRSANTNCFRLYFTLYQLQLVSPS